MVRIYGVTSTSGGSSGSGDSGVVSLSGITMGNSSVYLTSNGSSSENSQNIFTVSSNTAVECDISIVATTDTAPKYSASWSMNALISRHVAASTTKLIGIGMVEVKSDDQLKFLTVSISENIILGGLSIQCTGVSQYTSIKWIATITATEV